MTEPWVQAYNTLRALQGRPSKRVIAKSKEQDYDSNTTLRVAPVGLCLLSFWPTQGLVALTGLRTLGSGRIAPLGLILRVEAWHTPGWRLIAWRPLAELKDALPIASADDTLTCPWPRGGLVHRASPQAIPSP